MSDFDVSAAQRSREPAVRVWLILWKAAHAIEKNAMQSVSSLGLGLSDFAVLEVLLHKGPLPVNTVGKQILLTSSSITAAIDRLEARKLLRRVTTPRDRRSRIVELTEAGRRLIERAFHERAELVRLLKKVGLWAAARLDDKSWYGMATHWFGPNPMAARECEVMTLVVSGMLNKQIASEIGASEATVKIHRGHVMQKMQAGSIVELVRMADKLKLSSS
jgi:MarR family 2-MHQ and catechol resistance regulon transcriptional repressor